VQQRQGAVDGTPQAGGISVSDPSDRFERAAEANADRVMSSVGSTSSVQRDAAVATAGPGGAAAQRQEEEPEEG
jgi:hypothetical protein